MTTVVSRTPKRGREKEYEDWLHGVVELSQRWPGHLGATILKPHGGGRAYTLVFRFDTVEHLQAWDTSDERRAWVARGQAMCERGDALKRMTGMETWFALPGGGSVVPPPRWKMALVSFCVAFPIIQALNATLGRLLANIPALARGACLGASMVLLMTYVAMPLATRVCRDWLYPVT